MEMKMPTYQYVIILLYFENRTESDLINLKE